MDSSVVIRPADAKDAYALVALNNSVQRVHAATEPAYFKEETIPEEVSAFFDEAISTPNSHIFIAEKQLLPAGYIWFETQTRPSTPFTHRIQRIYVHHIAVAAEFHRDGIGTMLLRASEAEAIAQGISQIALDFWSFNEGAQAFFRASGFVPSNVMMRKNLG